MQKLPRPIPPRNAPTDLDARVLASLPDATREVLADAHTIGERAWAAPTTAAILRDARERCRQMQRDYWAAQPEGAIEAEQVNWFRVEIANHLHHLRHIALSRSYDAVERVDTASLRRAIDTCGQYAESWFDVFDGCEFNVRGGSRLNYRRRAPHVSLPLDPVIASLRERGALPAKTAATLMTIGEARTFGADFSDATVARELDEDERWARVAFDVFHAGPTLATGPSARVH